jgi:HD-GYP domain-containing protein (c-di-GMP phosphodiesterase class II)
MAQVLNIPEKEIDDLATAALVHDIGLTKLSEQDFFLFSKPAKNYSAGDKRIYNLHVKDAVEMLRDKDYITKEVITLILNHEERLSGSGPNKLTKLMPCEEILSLVNTYDKLLISNKLKKWGITISKLSMF